MANKTWNNDYTMVRLTGLYQCTNQLSSHTKYTDIWYMKAYWCTAYTGSLLDQYVSPIPSGMPRYNEPWIIQ